MSFETNKPWEHFKVEGETIIFTIPEPEKFDQRLLRELKIESETPEHIGWRIANEYFIRVNSISQKQRQNILYLFKQGGISVGEVAEVFDVEADVVGDLLMFNIKSKKYFSEVSI